MSLRPHSHKTRDEAKGWLSEFAQLQQANGGILAKSGHFIELYKATLAIDATLTALSAADRYDLTTTRLSARAVLALACSGLFRGAQAEVRRCIESAILSTYFQDHPVEFATLQANPRHGFATDPRRPVSFCAFREFSYYSHYAGERLESERSGLATSALNTLATEYGNVSAAVHGTALVPQVVLPEPLEVTDAHLGETATLARRVFGAAAVVLAAFRTDAFANFQPMTRGWFDWLIGNSTSKKLKSRPFGLAG